MRKHAEVKRLWSEPHLLGIECSDGTLSQYASVWLRDNLRENRDPHSGQRLIDVADLPEDPKIRSVAIDHDNVIVEWEAESLTASFDIGWLLAQASNRPEAKDFRRRLWLEAAELNAARDFSWAAFPEAQSSRALRVRWLERLLQDGIAFLSQVPCSESGILEAAALMGRVAETNYGVVYDVRSVPQPENLAYSDLGLGLHTDNPYREPVPGFQLLHALVVSADGGESLFGDGVAMAEHLCRISPADFSLLTQTPVPFLYRSIDAELYAERPLIQLTCAGGIDAVHYNSRSIAPLRLKAGDAGAFYGAYRRFAAMLRDSRFHLQFKLRDGDLVAFDNQRVLHGRTAFSSARHARHLRGCYLTRDSVYSQTAVQRRELHPAGHQ